MLSSDSWLIDIGEQSHPNPMHRSSLFQRRLPKPVIGSGGLSSSRFDDDVPEVNCTWTASFSWRVKEAALWFESHGSKNLTGGTTWSSQSTSTDWLTRTHHWSSPRSKLAYKKPTSTRKLRKFPVTSGQGSKHRDWTASRWWARWRSQSSSCQHHVITWRGLMGPVRIRHSSHNFGWQPSHSVDLAGWQAKMASIEIWIPWRNAHKPHSGWSRILVSWFSRVTLPWLRGGTSVAPWRHKSSHVPVFRRLFDPSSRSNFDLGPSPSDSTEKTLSYQSLWFWSAVSL